MKTIKVQFLGHASVSSIVNTPNFDETLEWPLTFHAFSDRMKASVLETMIKSPERVRVSFTDETPRTGEWHEPIVSDSIINSF